MNYEVTVWKTLSSAEIEENCTLTILMYHVFCYIINRMDDEQYWHSPQNELKHIFKMHFQVKMERNKLLLYNGCSSLKIERVLLIVSPS